eukprot:CAMPEP_0197046562 /NCGR_PEP_ID=MMETSP1384-20130603/22256_1 /TAXON_ID=29189 /ORGANISM="Ammonia sp." /LENGTH=329 /DNA_ID=CAMNT_0042478379 /DNA_START=91 /DNA_END=1080 /DNA_ORIENTATION=-
MIKLLAVSATLLAHVVYSEQETILVTVYDVTSMYNNECVTSTTSAAPSSDTMKDENDYEREYDEYYQNYGQKYADKYGGGSYGGGSDGGASGGGDDSKWSQWSDKYQHEYQGSSNPGSVKGNEIGGDSYDASGSTQSATFCKCLEKVKEKGKSYAASQDDISKCIDKANGNDAKHWEKVSGRYQHKYGIKTDSWDAPVADTTAVGSSSDSSEDAAVLMAGVGAAGVAAQEGGEDALLPADDGRFGNAAVYITFIGTAVMLFICAWFIKDGLKKWKMREYQHVKQGSSYESEADADSNGNPYGGDDWDDQYDNGSAKKNRFASWNQYHAV